MERILDLIFHEPNCRKRASTKLVDDCVALIIECVSDVDGMKASRAINLEVLHAVFEAPAIDGLTWLLSLHAGIDFQGIILLPPSEKRVRTLA